ncbi:MAG: KAP family NTPase [Sporichthyaceae bacterium]|nr:KAP family NTPase [Sporichthyaceae bacterium]
MSEVIGDIEKAADLRSRDRSAAPPADWRDQFLAILGNHAKHDPKYQDWARRDHGFLVVDRRPTSLAVVQELCHGTRAHTWNRCLTARYRVGQQPSIGTALFALRSDLIALAGEDDDVEPFGDLRADTAALTWPGLARAIVGSSTDGRWAAEPGPAGARSYPASGISELLDGIGNSSLVGVGIRVVVLVEVLPSGSGPSLPAEEWRALLRLAQRLPERCGLVLSGFPREIELPAGDPHLLEIDLSAEPEQTQIAEPAGDQRYRYEPAALTNDRPATEDTLGHGPYAEALARLVLHPRTDAPLTIGIQAPWGKGKSSFMGFVSKALHDPGAGPPVITVWFNAWRFQDAQQIWAGLAEQITSTIEGSLTRWQRLRLRLSYGWRHRRSQLNWVVPALVVAGVLGLALAVGLPELAAGASATDELLQVFVPAGSVLLVASLVLGRAWRAIAPVTERLADYLRRPDYAAAMGYQHTVLEDLQFVVAEVRRVRRGCRFVVFVDDLDRCSDDRIMEVLQAIHLLLGDSEFFVFLGIDSEMIYRAIRRHYDGDDDSASLNPQFPEQYLSKIIQLSLFLPDPDDERTASYLSGMFSEAARAEYAAAQAAAEPQPAAEPALPPDDYPFVVASDAVVPARPVRWQEVEDTGHELGAVQDFLGRGGGNPRELKRLVNVHRLVKIVLQRPAGWSRERQRRLVLWLIVCAGWSKLVDDVLSYATKNPDAEDCLAPAAEQMTDPALKELLDARTDADKLPAAELTGQGELRLAAHVSRLIRTGAISAVPPTR